MPAPNISEASKNSPNATQGVKEGAIAMSPPVPVDRTAGGHPPVQEEVQAYRKLPSGDITEEGAARACSCMTPPRPPPPPPIPAAVLRQLFPGLNVTRDLLTKKGFCRLARNELRDLLTKISLLTADGEEHPQSEMPTWSTMASMTVPFGEEAGHRESKMIKTIDLTKGWRSTVDGDPKPRADLEEERRDIEKELAMELGRTRSWGRKDKLPSKVLVFGHTVLLLLLIRN